MSILRFASPTDTGLFRLVIGQIFFEQCLQVSSFVSEYVFMVWKILKWVGTGYGLLLTMAGGGLAFANIVGAITAAVQFGGQRAPDVEVMRTWMHGGWVFGVFIALVGAIATYRKRAKKRQLSPDSVDEQPSQLAPEPSSEQSASVGRPHGLLGSLAWGGIAGGILGTMLGCTFILLWFSVAYSPLAPRGWASSVSVEKHRVAGTAREEPVSVTNHPVALAAFAVPMVLCTVAGAVFGGVFGVTDLTPKRPKTDASNN